MIEPWSNRIMVRPRYFGLPVYRYHARLTLSTALFSSDQWCWSGVKGNINGTAVAICMYCAAFLLYNCHSRKQMHIGFCHAGTLMLSLEAVALCCIIVTRWNCPGGIEAWSWRPNILSLLWHCWLDYLVCYLTYNLSSGWSSLCRHTLLAYERLNSTH